MAAVRLPLEMSGLVWLEKILSIRVFVTLLILVGIIIVGIRKLEVIMSKKSEVAL